MEKVSVLSSAPIVNQDYSSKDNSLIESKVFNKTLGKSADRVEVHIYNSNGQLLDRKSVV